ncbi:DUF4876 domain-containing protein [Polaribacter atrinae]|uniref:SpaA-like prealbumin fold domain-containing protein n=1 Tax=Polaribacter atrinae TaxID=1333662 RepID=A0A176T669_9FLAO|nr:DUF4876 domain-containing protein [Polaribacter atrinae]OAD43434.1 hypothetical protein LPB303_13305 [Polaribacter atrinae]
MKQTILKRVGLTKLIALFLLISVAISCDSEDDIPNLGNLEVQVTLASGLNDISLADIDVTITQTVDNSTLIMNTDANGLATFSDISIGTYTVVVAHATEDYTLSGTANNVTVTRQETVATSVEVNAVNQDGGLVIKEVYTAGSGYITLFKDSFVEIFNNSSETLYADGMYIANLFGGSGATGDTSVYTVLTDTDYVYTDVMSQIPGSGTDYPVEAGKSIVIALNAINFKEGSIAPDAQLDNTDATLEHYSVDWLEAQGRAGNAFFELDNPAVPNMTNIYMFEGTNFFRLSTPASIVLVSADVTFDTSGVVDYTAPGSTSTSKLMKISIENVVDGVDILDNSGAADFKRMPSSLDAGYSYLTADGAISYTGLSSRRKVDEVATARFGRTILLDTNNSTVDFEAIAFPDKYGYNN